MLGPVFDAHLHIIDPAYPLIENQGYLPEAFTVSDYRDESSPLNIRGGAVVSGSFQGFDQTYLINALQQLGPGFVGVTQLPADTTNQTIQALDVAGVRAIRFNVKRGGSESLTQLETMARRVHEILGWHTELYIDSHQLDDLSQVLLSLPKVSIDHLGLSQAGFPQLLRLVEKGVRVKATGFGRIDFPIAQALTDLMQCNPDALMFGTDLPSTRAPRPFRRDDMRLILDTLGDADARRVFWDNAAAWYRLPELQQHAAN